MKGRKRPRHKVRKGTRLACIDDNDIEILAPISIIWVLSFEQIPQNSMDVIPWAKKKKIRGERERVGGRRRARTCW